MTDTQTKTVVAGTLRGNLKSEYGTLSEVLSQTSHYVTELRFHTMQLLTIYGRLVAELSDLHKNADCVWPKGVVFHQNLVNWSISFIRYPSHISLNYRNKRQRKQEKLDAGKDAAAKNAYATLREAYKLYLNDAEDAIDDNRTSIREALTRLESRSLNLSNIDLNGVFQHLSIQIQTSILNTLEFATPKNQCSTLAQLYNISNKEARLLASENLTTSHDERRKKQVVLKMVSQRKPVHEARDAYQRSKEVLGDDHDTTVTLLQKAVSLEENLGAVLNQAKEAVRQSYPDCPSLKRIIRKSNKPLISLEGRGELTYGELTFDEIVTREAGIGRREFYDKLNAVDDPDSDGVNEEYSDREKYQYGLELPFHPLDQIHLPDTQSQKDQLVYRYRLLRRLDQVEGSKKFNLLPQSRLGRIHITVDAILLRSFLLRFKPPEKKRKSHPTPSSQRGKKRISDNRLCEGDEDDDATESEEDESEGGEDDDDVDPPQVNPKKTMDELLQILLTPKCGKNAKSAKFPIFGDTFTTNGVALHLKLVTNANRVMKQKKAIARAAAMQEKKDLAAQGKERERNEKKTASSKKKKKVDALINMKPMKNEEEEFEGLKEGEIGVGVDGGVHNICGYYRKDVENPQARTISTKSYYNDTGITSRNKDMENRVKKERKLNANFEVSENQFNNVTTKTTNISSLVKALKAKGGSYNELHQFYGSNFHTKIRLTNYIQSQKVMERIVKEVLPTPQHVGLFGDAMTSNGNNMKGKLSGVFSKFEKVARRSRKIIMVDEFRSSILDSNRFIEMYHPVRVGVGLNKLGKKKVWRTTGLYQASIKRSGTDQEQLGYSKCWARDVNAPINILENFNYKVEHGSVRREFLRRNKLPSKSDPCRYKYTKKKESPKRLCTGFHRVVQKLSK